MEKRFIIMLLLLFVAVLYIAGRGLAEQCVDIDEYRQCWKTYDLTVTSDLCPSAEPCLATAQAQQHNAVTEVLLQACAKARRNSYSDARLSARIEEVAKTFTGYTISAQQLCNNPGAVLTKQQYG